MKFYYDHESHWVTDNVGSVIAVAPGSFQSELGCAGDWDPGCLRSWLQDVDGDGTYVLETTALPAGSYETKVAINEAWDENYGQGGVPGGANIAFTVPANNAKVTFTYVASTHVLTVAAGHGHDDNVEWDGLRHDFAIGRLPDAGRGGPGRNAGHAAAPDVPRRRDGRQGPPLQPPARRPAGRARCRSPPPACPATRPVSKARRCDFWSVTMPAAIASEPDNLWYRFLVTDGTDTDYYGDDTPALDGGLGATTDDAVDQSWALMQYVPASRLPRGPAMPSSTRSSLTASATATGATTRGPATSAMTIRS